MRRGTPLGGRSARLEPALRSGSAFYLGVPGADTPSLFAVPRSGRVTSHREYRNIDVAVVRFKARGQWRTSISTQR